MTAPAAQPTNPARRWGIGSVASAVLAVLPVAFVLLLVVAVDELWGYLLIPAVPAFFVMALAAVVLGIVGLVVASRQGRAGASGRHTNSAGTPWAWPAVGVTLGGAELVAFAAFMVAVS